VGARSEPISCRIPFYRQNEIKASSAQGFLKVVTVIASNKQPDVCWITLKSKFTIINQHDISELAIIMLTGMLLSLTI